MVDKKTNFLIGCIYRREYGEKNNKPANVVIARVILIENTVGILQNGYKVDHSISGNAESIGIIHILSFIHKG